MTALLALLVALAAPDAGVAAPDAGAAATGTGTLCAAKTRVGPSEAYGKGASVPGAKLPVGGTFEVQVDDGAKQTVSKRAAARFDGLTLATHRIRVWRRGRLLQTIRFRLDAAGEALCLKHKATYDSWSVVPYHPKRCRGCALAPSKPDGGLAP